MIAEIRFRAGCFHRTSKFRKPVAPIVLSLSFQRSLWNTESVFFSFEYAALRFHFPGKNHYAYRLEGFDEEWIDAGTRRVSEVTQILIRKYALRLKRRTVTVSGTKSE